MPLLRRPSIIQNHAALFVPAPGGSSPTWNPTANPAYQAIGFGANTATFSSQTINNPASSDVVVVFTGTKDAGPITGVTIGGDSMTLATETAASDTFHGAIWYKTGSTYTTPNIVLSQSGLMSDVFMAAGYLTGVNSTPGTPQARALGFSSNPHTTSAITVPSTGFGIVLGFIFSTSTATFNTGTKDFQISSSDSSLVVGNISASGSQTPSINVGDALSGMCAIPWGP